DILNKCSRLAGRPLPAQLLCTGIDTKLFRPGYRPAALRWRRTWDVPPHATLLVSNRLFQKRYGHPLLLEAFAAARPRLRVTLFSLFLLPEPLPEEDLQVQLLRRAESLKVSPYIRCVPEVRYAQMPELYAAADLLLNYPVMDSFPVSFLEAAACQRPGVSIRHPAYLGTFAETYFRLVEPGNLAELTEAIVTTLNEDPWERTARLAEARSVIEKNYHQDAMTAQLIDIYKALARGQVHPKTFLASA